MPVDFTPVQITVFRKPDIITRFLKKLPVDEFKPITDQCILFLTAEAAKRFMRRFGVYDVLLRGIKNHDFYATRPKEVVKPIINPKHLTKFKRKSFPEYIYCSIDGKRGFRVLTRPGGCIYCSGRLVKLSGRKWKGTNFYSVYE